MAFQVPIRRGEDHPASKLTNKERDCCRQLWREGRGRVPDLAREHGVHPETMRRIVHQPLDFPLDES